MRPGGYYIKVIPTGDHMKQVAELVYDDFIPHQSSIQKDFKSDTTFQILKVETVKKTIFLADKDLLNFISMTPYLYKFKQDQLASLKELSVTISFEIIMWKYK